MVDSTQGEHTVSRGSLTLFKSAGPGGVSTLPRDASTLLQGTSTYAEHSSRLQNRWASLTKHACALSACYAPTHLRSTSWHHQCLFVDCLTRNDEEIAVILVVRGVGRHFFALLHIHKVPEEAEMSYLADFYAPYLARNSNFHSETLYRDSWRLVEPDYAKTNFDKLV